MYLQRIFSTQNSVYTPFITEINNNINTANRILFFFFNVKHNRKQLFPGVNNNVYVQTVNNQIKELENYLNYYPDLIDEDLLNNIIFYIQNIINNANTSLLEVYNQNQINFLINN